MHYPHRHSIWVCMCMRAGMHAIVQICRCVSADMCLCACLCVFGRALMLINHTTAVTLVIALPALWNISN